MILQLFPATGQSLRRIIVVLSGIAALSFPSVGTAQSVAPASRDHYWRNFAAGFASSILFHEAGHLGTALALGARPSFGFDKGRPTIYSGIDSHAEPHKQFLFSSAGLHVQALLDEAILDLPHSRGGAFERGVLAGGIGTALFYVTIGRRGSVSDIDYIARTGALTRGQATWIYGGVAVLHALRIERNGAYVDFFARPAANGGLKLGVQLP
jgi:hypothetical protein